MVANEGGGVGLPSRPWVRRTALGLAAAAMLGSAAAWWVQQPDVLYDTTPVARADIEASVAAIGTLQPQRYVDVGAQVSGQVMRLWVQPGAEVKKGQLLVEIDPSVQQATVDGGRAALAGLRAQLAVQVSGPLLRRSVDGTLALDFALRYEPSDRTLRAHQIKVNQLSIDGLSPALSDMLGTYSTALAEQAMGQVVLYQLQDQDLALVDALAMEPGAITVTAQGLTVALVQKAPQGIKR